MTSSQWKTIALVPAALCVMFGALFAVAAPDRSDAPQFEAKCMYNAKVYARSNLPSASGSDQRGLLPTRLANPEVGGSCHL